MTSYLVDQVCSPPKLPEYLRSVYDLKPITGTPNDEEIMGVHAVILVANKVVDVKEMGDPLLLARLSDHLFDVQMAKYRNRCLSIVFPESAVYTPPKLPDHVTVKLEPITGSPSEEEVAKVQSAIRSYHQFVNAPSIFDPRVDMELSQHLFDIQMARYTQRARQRHVSSEPHEIPTLSSTGSTQAIPTEKSNITTNNAGTGATGIDNQGVARPSSDTEALERSNRLAEQANQLIDRSNQIVERVIRLVEQSNYPLEQSNKLAERSNELFGRLNEHLAESNRLAKESMQPVEKLVDVQKNINRVLVRIQHAIVRNHKGNTLSALGCLVNEEGETPEISRTTQNRTYTDFSENNGIRFPVVIDGVARSSYIRDNWLGKFVRFYGIDSSDTLFEDASTVHVKDGRLDDARIALSEYLSSCLG